MRLLFGPQVNYLAALMKANLEGGEDYATAQDVAGRTRSEKSNLPGETNTCFRQLNLQVKEANFYSTT